MCAGRTVGHEGQPTPRTSRAAKHPGNFSRSQCVRLGLRMGYLVSMRFGVQFPLLPKGKRGRKEGRKEERKEGKKRKKEGRSKGHERTRVR